MAFGPQQIIKSSPNWVQHAAAADFTADGLLDVVVATYYSNNVVLYVNVGGGVFGTGVPLTSTCTGARHLVVAPLNADSAPDVVAGCAGQTRVIALVNSGNGSVWTQTASLASSYAGTAFDVGLVNGDSINDLLVANTELSSIAYAPGVGNGSFGVLVPIALMLPSSSAFIVDLDRDTLGDVVELSEGVKSLRIAWRTSPSTYNQPVLVAVSVASMSLAFAAADWDADGHVDMVVTGTTPVTVVMLRNKGARTFATPVIVWSTNSTVHAWSLTAGDVNQDGVVDFAVQGRVGATPYCEVALLFGSADRLGNFTKQLLPVTCEHGRTIAFVDLTADGFTDLLLADSVPGATVLMRSLNVCPPLDVGNATVRAIPTRVGAPVLVGTRGAPALVNETRQVVCNAGYALGAGVVNRTCLVSRNYSGSPWHCDPVPCGALAVPLNGFVVGGLVTGVFRDTRTIVCNTAFALVGPTTVSCQANGTWTEVPICIAIPQPPAPPPLLLPPPPPPPPPLPPPSSPPCAPLVERDCAGICGGLAVYDMCGVCTGGTTGRAADADVDSCGICFGANALRDGCGVCFGRNETCAGCDGVPNSGRVLDACGVCGGTNATCLGCDGVPIPTGGKLYDLCGSCGGNATSCVVGCDGVLGSGLLFDCARVCNGTARIDDCGVCAGGNTTRVAGSFRDSCGVCFGSSAACTNCASGVLDACGVCNGNNATCRDCAGVPRGNSSYDRCGVCNGSGLSCVIGCDAVLGSWLLWDCQRICGGANRLDGCNSCYGPNVTGAPTADRNRDSCGVCYGGNRARDSCGVCFGLDATRDSCGVCDGGNAALSECGRCFGGDTGKDACGVCWGNSSTCVGCDGVAGSRHAFDACGACVGALLAGAPCALVASPSTRFKAALIIAPIAAVCCLLVAVVIAAVLARRRRRDRVQAQFVAAKLAGAPTGQVCLVRTTIENWTALCEASTSEMELALALHNVVVREVIFACDGYEYQSEGDSFCIAFDSPLNALAFCALVHQRMVGAAWSPWVLEKSNELGFVRAASKQNGKTRLWRGPRIALCAHAVCATPELDEHTGRANYAGPEAVYLKTLSALAAGGQSLVTHALVCACKTEAVPLAPSATSTDLLIRPVARVRLDAEGDRVELWDVVARVHADRAFALGPLRDKVASVDEIPTDGAKQSCPALEFSSKSGLLELSAVVWEPPTEDAFVTCLPSEPEAPSAPLSFEPVTPSARAQRMPATLSARSSAKGTYRQGMPATVPQIEIRGPTPGSANPRQPPAVKTEDVFVRQRALLAPRLASARKRNGAASTAGTRHSQPLVGRTRPRTRPSSTSGSSSSISCFSESAATVKSDD